MSNFETETNGALVATAPLFASVWLALFYVLRKNFNERRLSIATKSAETQQLRRK